MIKLEEIFDRKYYPDGTMYSVIRSKTIFDKYDDVLFHVNSYEDLFFLAYCKEIYNFHDKNISLYIPCLLEQQADKRDNDSEDNTSSFGLKVVADFINNLKFISVSIFHPHSDVSSALIDRCKIIDNSKFITKVLNEINTENLILMSTDAGGFKPLMKLVDKINWKGETYSATKSREYVDGKSKLTQIVDRNDFGGKDIILIDDVCLYGGTFIGLAKMLKEKNVGKLYLAVSHITLKSPNKLLEEYFDRIYSTNSKYDEYDLNNLTIFKNTLSWMSI